MTAKVAGRRSQRRQKKRRENMIQSRHSVTQIEERRVGDINK